MNGKMPTMPNLNNSLPGENDGAAETQVSVAPFINDSEDEIEVSIPKGPIYNKPEDNISNSIKAPASSKVGIKVIALRKGFMGQERIKIGDEFIIPSMKKFGTWMKLADPIAEKQRQKMLKEKKANN